MPDLLLYSEFSSPALLTPGSQALAPDLLLYSNSTLSGSGSRSPALPALLTPCSQAPTPALLRSTLTVIALYRLPASESSSLVLLTPGSQPLTPALLLYSD